MNLAILLYHGLYRDRSEIAGKPALEYVAADDFRRQIEWLKDQGYALLSIGSCRRREEHGDLPERSVGITFDDGKRSDFHLAAPILAELGGEATFYVIPGWLGGRNIMTKEQVRELSHLPGVEIGAHSQTHPFLTALPPANLAREVTAPKAFLEDLLGRPVESFSYPFGDSDARVRAAVRQAGYRTGCGTRRGANRTSPEWLNLRRWGIHETTGVAGLRRMLERGRPSLAEEAGELVRMAVGTARYVRWRDRLARRAGG